TTHRPATDKDNDTPTGPEGLPRLRGACVYDWFNETGTRNITSSDTDTREQAEATIRHQQRLLSTTQRTVQPRTITRTHRPGLKVSQVFMAHVRVL
ncbi:unnamed protein product, partial [Ectocarpus fasciculatus]